MSESIEEQLRRVLAQSATLEVPDSLPIPPRRPVDEIAGRRTPRRWLAPAISGVAAAVIAVVATLLVVHHGSPTDGVAQPAQVAVPRVVGVTLVRAEREITGAGLTLGTVTSIESATVQKGLVVSQQSSPGTLMARGAPVDLAVSSGVGSVPADLVTVPDLTTLTAAEAEAQLTVLHLVMKTDRVASTEVDKNKVLGQNPPANRSLKSGGTVTVEIGSGPNVTTVPTGLVGMSYDGAVAALEAAHLTATQQVVDGTAALNTVVGVTGGEPGASLQEGTPIVLQTSNNQLFVVPNLADLSTDDAAAQLDALGWTGSADSFQQYSSPSTDPALIGTIAHGPHEVRNPNGSGTVSKPGQDPAAGATVRKSAPFEVVVYGKKQIAVPTFVPGVTTTDQAVGALQDLGVTNIKVITQQPAVPPAAPHTFVSMTPKSGSVVDFDTPVTVTVRGDAPAPPTTRATTTK